MTTVVLIVELVIWEEDILVMEVLCDLGIFGGLECEAAKGLWKRIKAKAWSRWSNAKGARDLGGSLVS